MSEFLANMKEVVAITSAALSLLTTIFVLVAKLTKNVKLRKLAERITFFREQVEKYVALAEEIVNFKGKDKKEWVVTKVNQAAIDAGIQFDADVVSQLIEEVVNLTKIVNARDKDKIKREEL